MARLLTSLPALRRRISCAANPEYARELQSLNDPPQVRRGRFGGLTRALRRNQRVSDWKVPLAVKDGWNVPDDLRKSVQKALARRHQCNRFRTRTRSVIELASEYLSGYRRTLERGFHVQKFDGICVELGGLISGLIHCIF